MTPLPPTHTHTHTAAAAAAWLAACGRPASPPLLRKGSTASPAGPPAGPPAGRGLCLWQIWCVHVLTCAVCVCVRRCVACMRPFVLRGVHVCVRVLRGDSPRSAAPVSPPRSRPAAWSTWPAGSQSCIGLRHAPRMQACIDSASWPAGSECCMAWPCAMHTSMHAMVQRHAPSKRAGGRCAPFKGISWRAGCTQAEA